MNRIGIMQGRLVPPVGNKIQAFPAATWEREFPLAADAELAFIECVYEDDGHPLATDAGIERMKALISEHGVAVRSVCADYYMNNPMSVDSLVWFLDRCWKLGVQRVVLPFVDQSSMSSAKDEASVANILTLALPHAAECGVELHVETDFSPERFQAFLERVPGVFVNYDTGNSASLGFDPLEELAAYGRRIGSVHVKDRIRGGTTVPLGQGNADFASVFRGLKQLEYTGDFTLQVARGVGGDELGWAQKNREFVEHELAAY